MSYMYMKHVPSFDVWRWEVDLSVESARSEEGGIKHILSVGARQHYNINSSVEACEGIKSVHSSCENHSQN